LSKQHTSENQWMQREVSHTIEFRIFNEVKLSSKEHPKK